MNFRTIDIVGRALGQYQDSTKNLMAIGNARRKMAQEQEDREFKKREAELNLEKAKREGKMSELEFDILNTQHKEYQKQQDKIASGADAMIKIEEHKNKKAADEAMTVTGKMFEQDPDGTAAAMAVVRGQQQRTQLRPKFSYGRVGYETVDLEEEKAAKAEKAGYTRKDVVARADRLYKESKEYPDPNDKKTYEDFLAESEELLSGKPREKSASSVADGNGMGVGYKKSGAISSKYKPGEIKTVKGKRYKKSESGQWKQIP